MSSFTRRPIQNEQTRLIAFTRGFLGNQFRGQRIIEIGRLHRRSVPRLQFDTKAICCGGGARWGEMFLTIYFKTP